MALVIAITSIAILTVMLAEMHESTGTAWAVTTAHRDRLQAEYMAKSGINLTRLLVANEPRIRQIAAPLYQAMIGRPPPQLPVWTLASEILAPFCQNGPRGEDDEEMRSIAASIASSAQGLDDIPGTCEIVALAENSKINVNDPLFLDGDRARRSIAMQIFAMIGGYQSPSPYDPLFSARDADGNFHSRLDVVSGLIDWWDVDTDRSNFDPGAGTVESGGSEDDIYQRLDDPYFAKNAPFDTLQEIRLVRGVTDDFWATFVEPTPGDQDARIITIYGSGAVNPNEAPPEVLLARLCSFIESQTLCVDPLEAAKFIQIMNIIRGFKVPFFTRPSDFLNFVEGRGGGQDLYPMLVALLGEGNPLLFVPVTIPREIRAEVDRSYVTSAKILTIQATGVVGGSSVRIHTVTNFHERWAPPPPNAGSMPGLGVYHYYRID